MRKLILAGAAALAFSGAALADPALPTYDAPAFCRAQPPFPLSDYPNEHDCISTQHTFRMTAALVWPKISADAKRQCLADAGGDYVTLFACANSYR